SLAGLGTWVVCKRVGVPEIAFYSQWAAKIGIVLAEFWFLLALAGSGATLRRPASVRAVGLFELFVGLGIALYYVGWDIYIQKVGPEIGRPRIVEPGSDWQFYEA